MKKIYLYPLWLRIWHWTNATLFLILIITGISMHYSSLKHPFIPFRTARMIHNVSGLLLMFMYLDFLIGNLFTWNGKHYIPNFKGLFNRIYRQTRFYLFGIFRGESHPYEATENLKFNPLQQITYITIMFIFMPLIVISGLFLLFPEFAPQQLFGMDGLWPMAIIHAVVAYFLTLFTIGHIYLGTTGHTITSNFKGMIEGYHIILHTDKKQERAKNEA